MTTESPQQAGEASVESGGPGGYIGSSPRGESGLSGVRESRLEQRAIREGWAGERSQRWRTDATAKELAAIGPENMTMKDRLALAVVNDSVSPDARIRQIAVRSGVAMEKQNQMDEHHRDQMENGFESQPVNVNVGVGVSVELQPGDLVREAVENEPEFLDYLRQKQLAGSGNAGIVRENGDEEHAATVGLG